ncbi:ABC transporter substrate-binding protein [Pseudomonas baltica]|uniref:ABC transporter substrate-binding protein n=1 Tax=Pseudomonas baltica TaxID=2762576 RepID=UPI00289842D0|nr:ABC transporter substrate-binding protein [Pseudomonas baltica]
MHDLSLVPRRAFAMVANAVLAGSLLLSATAFAADTAPANGNAAASEQGAQRGGVLKAVIQPEPPTLAFFINTATPTRAVASKIFDGLFDYGPDLKPRPQLAQSLDISPDGLTVTFKLRPNVQWHDGQAFTAADVKFSAEVIWKKYAPTARRIFQNLTSVDTPDDLTVVLHLSKPAPVLVNALDVVSAPILPKHLYEGTDILNNPYNNKPVGTGPFVFKEWQRGSFISLTRNEHYWEAGKPYLDGIVWKIIPDVAGRATAFETGDVQYGERNPVTFADAKRLAKLPDLEVSTDGYNGFASWFWLMPNLRDPILGKLQVRQAIAHAIDRQALVKTVWNGYAVPATGPVSSLLKGFYDKDTQQYNYDPAEAERLLDAAGFPRQADGWRFKLNHDYIPYGDDYKRTGEFVRQALRKVGIDVTLRSLDLATWTKNVFTDYNFQLVSSWGANWQDPQLGVEQHFWSRSESKGTPWLNATGYANPEMDAALEDAQTQLDPAKRVLDYNKVQELAQRDLSQIVQFEFRWFGIWDRQLRNVTDTYDHSQSNFAHVWLAPKAGAQ